LAFALTAGFSVENKYTCDVDSIQETRFTVEASYPYDEYDATASTNNDTVVLTETFNLNKHYSSGAEFFVAWGVLSMIYCLVAILVYMLITANEELVRVNNIMILAVSLWSVSCEVDMGVYNFMHRTLF